MILRITKGEIHLQLFRSKSKAGVRAVARDRIVKNQQSPGCSVRIAARAFQKLVCERIQAIHAVLSCCAVTPQPLLDPGQTALGRDSIVSFV